MVKSLIVVSEGNIDKGITTAGTIQYFWLGTGHTLWNATEIRRQVTFQSAGTLSHLFVRIIANSANGTITIRTRKNATNGNLVVSIPTGYVGVLEDTSHTDTVTAGDEFTFQVTATGTTGTITANIVSVIFDATTNCVTKLIAEVSTHSTASATHFAALTGDRTGVITVEADMQNTVKQAGTAKNLMGFMQANARTTNTVYTLRKNGVDTALTATVAPAATGIFEDTTHTVAVAADDKLCWAITTGAGTESQTPTFISLEYVTSTQHAIISAGMTTSGSNYTVATNLTRYLSIGGGLTGTATEADIKLKTRMQVKLMSLTIKVGTNTLTAASTFRIRINGADGNQSITIPAATTGYFSDDTNFDMVNDNDDINYQLVTGASGTSIVITQLQISTIPYHAIQAPLTETQSIGESKARQKGAWRLQP